MALMQATPRLIDTGQAVEIYCDAMGEARALGRHNACFSYYRVQFVGRAEEHHVVLRVIMPMDAIGANIDMIARTFGRRLILPYEGGATRLLMQ